VCPFPDALLRPRVRARTRSVRRDKTIVVLACGSWINDGEAAWVVRARSVYRVGTDETTAEAAAPRRTGGRTRFGGKRDNRVSDERARLRRNVSHVDVRHLNVASISVDLTLMGEEASEKTRAS
jgi:hypothetical protein